MRRIGLTASLVLFLSACTAGGQNAVDAQYVYFVSPTNGASVTSPVKIQMGVHGMGVKAAGSVEQGSGHHHIIVGGPHVPEGQVVPADETHIHFGKGQTETDLDLKPGEYTLRLQFADGVHQSYGKGMSTAITITVVEGGGE